MRKPFSRFVKDAEAIRSEAAAQSRSPVHDQSTWKHEFYVFADIVAADRFFPNASGEAFQELPCRSFPT
jgi:hypothetical protein